MKEKKWQLAYVSKMKRRNISQCERKRNSNNGNNENNEENNGNVMKAENNSNRNIKRRNISND